MRRARTLVCAWAMGAVVFVAAGLPSLAADTTPADALLDRARDAVATHEFAGVVRISWRTATGLHSKNVPVRAVDGGLRLAHGDLVEDDGRAWMRTQTRWETLWSDTRAPEAPSVTAKYHVRIGDGPGRGRAPDPRAHDRAAAVTSSSGTRSTAPTASCCGGCGSTTTAGSSAAMTFVQLGPVARPAAGR